MLGPTSRSLRAKAKTNAASDIREFFELSQIPRVEDKILTQFVQSASGPIWKTNNELLVPDTEDNDEHDTEEVLSLDESSPADSLETSITSMEELLPTKKTYVTEGIYSHTRSKSQSSKQEAFPLPINDGMDAILKEKDFLLPWSIYCPTDSVKKVPNWKPMRKNAWIDVPIPAVRPRDQRPSCFCVDKCGEDCLNRMLQCECDPETCPLGETNCGNRALQDLSKALYAGKRYANGFEVVSTGNRGYGLRATRSYAPGELILEYTGDVISSSEMQRRLRTIYAGTKNFYFLSLEKGHVIDSGTRGSAARFVNHSCNPNTEMQKWYVNDTPRIGLFAGRNRIHGGEELTYDYNFDWFEGTVAQECKCGSDNCRGIIGRKSLANGIIASNGSSSKSPSRPSSAESFKQKVKRTIRSSPIKNHTKKEVLAMARFAKKMKSEVVSPVDAQVSLARGATILPGGIIKRGRGRPRKIPLAPRESTLEPTPEPEPLKTNVEIVNETEFALKRRRGRPRKDRSDIADQLERIATAKAKLGGKVMLKSRGMKQTPKRTSASFLRKQKLLKRSNKTRTTRSKEQNEKSLVIKFKRPQPVNEDTSKSSAVNSDSFSSKSRATTNVPQISEAKRNAITESSKGGPGIANKATKTSRSLVTPKPTVSARSQSSQEDSVDAARSLMQLSMPRFAPWRTPRTTLGAANPTSALTTSVPTTNSVPQLAANANVIRSAVSKPKPNPIPPAAKVASPGVGSFRLVINTGIGKSGQPARQADSFVVILVPNLTTDPKKIWENNQGIKPRQSLRGPYLLQSKANLKDNVRILGRGRSKVRARRRSVEDVVPGNSVSINTPRNLSQNSVQLPSRHINTTSTSSNKSNNTNIGQRHSTFIMNSVVQSRVVKNSNPSITGAGSRKKKSINHARTIELIIPDEYLQTPKDKIQKGAPSTPQNGNSGVTSSSLSAPGLTWRSIVGIEANGGASSTPISEVRSAKTNTKVNIGTSSSATKTTGGESSAPSLVADSGSDSSSPLSPDLIESCTHFRHPITIDDDDNDVGSEPAEPAQKRRKDNVIEL